MAEEMSKSANDEESSCLSGAPLIATPLAVRGVESGEDPPTENFVSSPIKDAEPNEGKEDTQEADVNCFPAQTDHISSNDNPEEPENLAIEGSLVYKYGYSSSEDGNDDPPFPTEVVSTIEDRLNANNDNMIVTGTQLRPKGKGKKRKPKRGAQVDVELQQAMLRRCLNKSAISQVFQVACDSFNVDLPVPAPSSIFAGLQGSDSTQIDEDEAEGNNEGALDLSKKHLLNEEQVLCAVAFGDGS
jgi:hypothetical protein